ncbi:hypothetical protein TNCV_5135411 [Trichonephila clavipes]|nr:hypothetical protein TNCV_5135411 [Trichonephila clavipes]
MTSDNVKTLQFDIIGSVEVVQFIALLNSWTYHAWISSTVMKSIVYEIHTESIEDLVFRIFAAVHEIRKMPGLALNIKDLIWRVDM